MSHSPLPMATSDRFCWNSHRVPEAYRKHVFQHSTLHTESSALNHRWPHSLLPVSRPLNVDQIWTFSEKLVPEMQTRAWGKLFPAIQQQNMAIINRDKAVHIPWNKNGRHLQELCRAKKYILASSFSHFLSKRQA
jgi:hypothetical protein